MGVQGLLTYLREHDCGKDVDIAEECLRSVQESNHHNSAPKNILVVDGNGLARHLCNPKSLDWSRGGQWHGIRTNTLNFLASFAAVNIELHLVWDGTSSPSKLQVRRTRYAQRVRDATKAVASFVENGARFSDERLVLPPSFLNWLKTIFRDAGVIQITARSEGDKAAVLHCNRVGAIGILADDSDFVVFEIPRLFLMESLRYRICKPTQEDANNSSISTMQKSQSVELIRPTATVLRKNDVRTVLNIPSQLYPLFSCLVGNDYIASIKLNSIHAALMEYGTLMGDEIIEGGRQQHLIDQVLVWIRGTAADTNAPSAVVRDMLEQQRTAMKNAMQKQSQATVLGEIHQKYHWPEPVFAFGEGRAADLSNRYVCAVLTGDHNARMWHTGEFCSSKKLAKHSAARIAVESDHLRASMSDNSVTENGAITNSTTFSPDIERVLQYVFTIANSSRGDIASLRCAIHNALREFDVTGNNADDVSDVVLHPRLACATTMHTVPDVLVRGIEHCRLSASTWKVLAYGKIDHGTILHVPFPVTSATHVCNYYMDSLRLRRVCYGLLLAPTTSTPSRADARAADPTSQEDHYVHVCAPPADWEGTGLYIVEHLDKMHVANIAPLYLRWQVGNGGYLQAHDLLAESDDVCHGTDGEIIDGITPAGQMAFHAFLVAAGIESQADRLWLYTHRCDFSTDTNAAQQHVVFCLVARTLLRSASGLSDTELMCLLAHYVLIQHHDMGAVTSTWDEASLPPVSANGVWLATRYQYTMNKMLWLHELCGLPLKYEFSVERLFDGRILHAVHHVLCSSFTGGVPAQTPPPFACLSDVDHATVMALRVLVCSGDMYKATLSPLSQSVRTTQLFDPTVYHQAADFLFQLRKQCPAQAEMFGEDFCRELLQHAMPFPTFLCVGEDRFTFAPTERAVASDATSQRAAKNHDQDPTFDFTTIVAKWTQAQKSQQSQAHGKKLTTSTKFSTKVTGTVEKLHIHLTREHIDLKLVEYKFEDGRNADGSNFYVCSINIKPKKISHRGPPCSSKKGAKDKTCQQVFALLTAARTPSGTDMTDDVSQKAPACTNPSTAAETRAAGALASVDDEHPGFVDREHPGSASRPTYDLGMDTSAAILCVATVVALAASLYMMQQRLRRA